jgi:hypothetical protein
MSATLLAPLRAPLTAPLRAPIIVPVRPNVLLTTDPVTYRARYGETLTQFALRLRARFHAEDETGQIVTQLGPINASEVAAFFVTR